MAQLTGLFRCTFASLTSELNCKTNPMTGHLIARVHGQNIRRGWSKLPCLFKQHVGNRKILENLRFRSAA